MRWIKESRRFAGLVSAKCKSWLGPSWTGFLAGIGSIAGLAAVVAYFAIKYSLADPSAALFQGLAQVGVGLFVAFSVTIASVELREGTRDEHRNWLGFGCGTGLAGLIGIGACLALSSYREAEHSGLIDIVGFSWAVPALGMLGVVIAAGPLMIYRSREPGHVSDESE